MKLTVKQRQKIYIKALELHTYYRSQVYTITLTAIVEKAFFVITKFPDTIDISQHLPEYHGIRFSYPVTIQSEENILLSCIEDTMENKESCIRRIFNYLKFWKK